MSGLRNSNILLTLYKDIRTVFRLIDIAMLVEEPNKQSLSKKLNYYVRKGQLQNPRKGIYTKENYSKEEYACRLYVPSYISLEYVLQKAGVIFQFNSEISSISYLSRNINFDNTNFKFRKIKNEILFNTTGIIRQDNHVNIATPERAFLDMLYLNADFYFDIINTLKKDLLWNLIPIYQTKTMLGKLKEYVGDV